MDIFALLVTLLLGLASGYWFAHARNKKQAQSFKRVKSLEDEELPLPNFSQKPRLDKKERRVIVVAKQLPINATRQGGDWKVEWSDTRDFLANLRVLKSTSDVRWVGAPNIAIPRDLQVDFDSLMEEHACHPVYLNEDVKDRFFSGFCKGVLWPMLHYVTPHQQVNTFARQWDDLWAAYKTANMLYAREVGRVLESPDDIVWVHNYHLLLLPSLLRAKVPRTKIGVFIHTPFPSSDVFRVLPAREAILRSIMCADMIGFHTFDYARHFLSCCKRILDLEFETMAGGTLGVKYQGRYVSIVISHVGIDSRAFADMAKQADTLQRARDLKKRFGDRRILIGVDDLDLVKGSVLKLQAYDRFLLTKPEWKDRVVLLQVLLPTSVQEHEKQQVGAAFMAEIAGLKSRHGAGCVELIESKDMSIQQLVAAYVAADVAVVSTFWDGLNMVPLEYTAAQDSENPGTLVLSEFMGCSRALSGVLRVNPWSLDQVAEAIGTALDTPLEERKANHARRYTYVMNHDCARWATGFVQRLEEATELGDELVYQQVGFGSTARTVGLRADFVHLDDRLVSGPYRAAPIRLLLLDYDGTLTAAHKNDTRKKLNAPTPRVKKLLRALCEDKRNTVFLIAGRERKQLAQWFGDIKELGLAAEKGCFIRWPASRAHLYRNTPLLKVSESLIASKPGKLSGSAIQAHLAAHSLHTSLSTSSLPSATLEGSLATVCTGATEHAPGAARTLSAKEATELSLAFLEERARLEQKMSNENEYIDNEWETMVQNTDDTWHAQALEIIKSYTEHTDGSWIEDKEFAIVWHYESADPEYGRMQASELVKYLLQVLPAGQVDVVKYESNRILEVKPHGIGKGVTVAHILRCVLGAAALEEKTSSTSTTSAASPSGSPITAHRASSSAGPFILCVGDDRSDEDMFRAVHRRDDLHLQSLTQLENDTGMATTPLTLSSSSTSHARNFSSGQPNNARTVVERERDERRAPNSFTACVGLKPSAAKFYMRDHEDVQKLLQHLVHCSEKGNKP